MKKFLFPALALGLVMTSCQSDEPFAPGMGEEVQATFTISVPEAMGTRAAGHSSAEGGYTNGAGQLNYTVVLLNDADKVMYSATSTGNGTSATFSPTVVQGYTYKILAYATFGDVIAAPVNDTFDGADALANIATLKGINDESEDAYFCNATVTGATTMSADLKRPFGKLRLVATDYNKLKDLGQDVKSVKVTYGNTVVMETHFNAYAEAFGGQATSKEWSADKTVYQEAADNELTVFADYLPAGNGETMYPFTIVTTYSNGETYTRTFSQDIPVKRNYLTTLRGDFFTTEAALTLKVEEMFDGETDERGALLISSANDLINLAERVENGESFDDKTVILTSDIDLSTLTRSEVSNWTPIGTSEKPFKGTFDGNGFTIKNLKIVESEAKEGKAYIGFFGYAKDATIKNVTFENVNLNIPCLDIDHSQGHIGAVAGSLEGTSTIENVTVKGDIKVYATQDANGASRVAVVAGGNSYGNVTMNNVHVIANEGSYLMANNNTGALAGQLQGKMVFENCSSNIDVTVNKFFAGGLVGIAAGDSYFKNCHTTGDVAVVAGRAGRANDHYRVGGIAGGWADGKTNVCTLEGCSYTGTISGRNSDGSLAEVLDYMGYVGRGYTLANCEGSKVIIDNTEFVQVGNSAPYGNYNIYINVSGANELAEALNSDIKFINLKEGEYGTIVAKSGKTIIGSVNAKVDAVNLNGADNVTLKNINFDAAKAVPCVDGQGTYKMYANIMTGVWQEEQAKKGAHNLVIDNCTFEGSFKSGKPGAAIAFADYYRTSGFSGNVIIKNCKFETVTDYGGYDIYGHYCGNGTNGYGDFVIENNIFKSRRANGNPVYLGRYASSTPVVVKGNKFETVSSLEDAVYVQAHSESYSVSIDASGNTFTN